MSSQSSGGARFGRGEDGPPTPVDRDAESSLRRQRRDRRQMFERRELLELRQERRVLLGQALTWAMVVVIPAAVIGWTLGYAMAPMSAQLSPGWTQPMGLIRLLLGAVCGALGGATA